MKKLFDFLYYGGLKQRNQEEIYQDITESNRRSVVAYSTISTCAFFVMTLYSTFGHSFATQNRLFYIFGVIIMAILLLLNFHISPKHHNITTFSTFLFIFGMYAIGIFLAISGKDDITASYMVFLFVTPLLFIVRPLYIIIVILLSNVCYISIMYGIQTPQVFQKDLINAIIYGFVSIFVSSTMTRMKIQKIETDYINRILMEKDQLTGMLNRRSFEQHIEHGKEIGSVTGIKLGVFDVNGLKMVNDNLGHHAGDELIRGAAACLENVFSHYGLCYRIGGDEFVAILKDPSPTEEELLDMLNKQTASFKGTYVPSLSISSGIVIGTEKDNMIGLLRQADAKMYKNKAEYYRINGIDRRKR